MKPRGPMTDKFPTLTHNCHHSVFSVFFTPWMCRLWFSLPSFCFSYFKINLEFHFHSNPILTPFDRLFSHEKRIWGAQEKRGCYFCNGDWVQCAHGRFRRPGISAELQSRVSVEISLVDTCRKRFENCTGFVFRYARQNLHFHWNTIQLRSG